MIGLVAALVAALGVGGVLLFIDGMTRRPPARKSKPSFHTPSLWQALNRDEQLLALAAFVVALVIALATGWLIFLVALPVGVVGVPRLVRNTSMKRATDRLQALEDWTRSLSGVLTSGLVLEHAIHASRRAAPSAIAKEVNALCRRLRTGMPTDEALRLFANELDDATGDLVALMLIEAARFQGVALADQLTGVAASVSEDVRSRRQIMAAQREPQSTASLMTWISVASLGLVALMGDFIQPYKSPAGHIVLLTLLGMYGGLLWTMKQIATPPAPPRILGPDSRRIEPVKDKR